MYTGWSTTTCHGGSSGITGLQAQEAAVPNPSSITTAHTTGNTPSADDGKPSERGTLTEAERSSLQAQLTLLASQLTEISELDEVPDATDDEPAGNIDVDAGIATVSVTTVPDAAPKTSTIDVNQFPEDIASSLPLPDFNVDVEDDDEDDDDDDDDDDMEMVEVP